MSRALVHRALLWNGFGLCLQSVKVLPPAAGRPWLLCLPNFVYRKRDYQTILGQARAACALLPFIRLSASMPFSHTDSASQRCVSQLRPISRTTPAPPPRTPPHRAGRGPLLPLPAAPLRLLRPRPPAGEDAGHEPLRLVLVLLPGALRNVAGEVRSLVRGARSRWRGFFVGGLSFLLLLCLSCQRGAFLAVRAGKVSVPRRERCEGSRTSRIIPTHKDSRAVAAFLRSLSPRRSSQNKYAKVSGCRLARTPEDLPEDVVPVRCGRDNRDYRLFLDESAYDGRCVLTGCYLCRCQRRGADWTRGPTRRRGGGRRSARRSSTSSSGCR